MKPELAQYVIINLVNISNFFKGFLYGKNAWGALGFPDPKKEPEELSNLVWLLRDIADGIEKLKEKE